ncbi:hypothetical protein BDV59DRAFT_210455 [Aspergillus ambiguus]|uniref:SRPBCC family protein n=1 Tax=Aspergillus ambiguus TaxID=176160 RepID=UPI003CCCFDB2
MDPTPKYLSATPHPFSILPQHPSLPTPSNRPSPPSFLHALLTEAHTFLTSVPTTFHHDPKPRPSPPATAPVHLSTHTTQTRHFWACRTSTHANAPIAGSASWAEFRAGLRTNHAQHEMAYTPSVTAVDTLLSWPEQREIDGGWGAVEMQVNMITHTFHPTALISPRTFLVLAVSADRVDSDGDTQIPSFVTVQIPLVAQSASESESDSGSDSVPVALREKIATAAPRRAVFASYASVERVVCRDRDRTGDVEWTMATTSEAGGAIPQWVQRSWTMGGVPRAIVADVGLFIRWIAARRGVGGGPGGD